jgi:thioredoxin:protein disulfide reductase
MNTRLYTTTQSKQQVLVFLMSWVVMIFFAAYLSTAVAQTTNFSPEPSSWLSTLLNKAPSNSDLKQQEEPLSTEDAFKTTASRQENTFYINFKIAPKYYLYQEKIKVVLETNQTNSAQKNNKPLSLVFPTPIFHYDEVFKKQMPIYRNQLVLTVSLFDALKSKNTKNINNTNSTNNTNNNQSLDTSISFIVYSQGCADLGICYPPRIQRLLFNSQQTQAVVTELKKDPFLYTSTDTSLTTPIDINRVEKKNATQIINSNQQPLLSQLIHKQAVWLWVLQFLFLGSLLALTPCVLPMLPIVLSMVLNKNQEKTLTIWQTFQRTLTYVFGMCVSYTVLGVLAGLAGVGLSGFLQRPWVLITFSLLMVLMAGVQFNWYYLRLPEFMQRYFNFYSSNKTVIGTSKRGYVSLFFMGALSAVVVSPCVTPPLAGILLFISQTQDILKGALALFSLSFGMGLPLLAIALGGTNILPKSGAWMQQVSYTFGVLLLMVALWTVQSLLSPMLFALAVVGLLLLLAEHLGAFHSSQHLLSRAARLFKAVAWCVLIWAFMILVGVGMGHADIQRPLGRLTASFLPSVQSNHESIAFETVSSANLMTIIKPHANTVDLNQLPYIVDIYADWCVSCIEFERYTLTDLNVQNALKQFKRLRVDVTHNTVEDQQLMKRLGLFGPPAVVFYRADGQALNESTRVIGFKNAQQFLEHLHTIDGQLRASSL